jgi:serine/threonine protein kinase
VDELLPVVTATLSTPEEVADTIERALGDGVALLVLDADPEPAAQYVVELQCAALGASVSLLGVLAGDTVLGYTPMRLAPLGDDQIDALHAILEKHAAGPTSGRGPSGKYPAPGRTGDWKEHRSTPDADPNDEIDLLVGRTLGGDKYLIEKRLGGGAMGRVYRGTHAALRKPIAIKVLHRKFQKDPQFAERFHREALAASSLDHPNVLRVLDFGNERGILYIVMELLTGRDLRSILEEQGKLPAKRAVEIMTQVCAALAVAHEAGIVHRDIKPENIVVTSGRDDEGNVIEHVKVCDFGIADVQQVKEARATGTGGKKLTEEGSLCGTPEYMAPEQARGASVDARADLYACGVMLYEIVTGQVPFTGPDYISVLVAHASLDPRPPTSVDPTVDHALEQVILKAMAKDPRARHQNARELRNDLRAARDAPVSFAEEVKLAGPKSEEPPTRRSGTFEVEPPRELYAGPLEDPSAQFPEFFIAFTGAVARSSYYERGHPEFVRAMSRLTATMGPPLEGRGEISLARLDLPTGGVDLQVITGIGELLDLKKVLPQGVASAHGPRLAEVFVRRHLITVTLKEGIDADEMADCVELLCGPDVPVEQLRNQFLSRGLRHVSVLFASDLLGRERRLPWQVDLCIARLARDLRALPLLRGLDTAGLRRVRTQLIGDVLRMLRVADQVRLLLSNVDLISSSTRHVPELADLDIAEAIVSAIPQPLAVKLASMVLSDLDAPGARRTIELLAARFIKQRTIESDEVLRTLHDRAMVGLADLPPDLQTWVRAEQQAGALSRDPDQLLRSLDTANDQTYAAALHTAGLAMRVMARRGEAVPLFVLVTRLEQLVRGPRGPLVQRTLQSIADPDVLSKIGDVFLSGAADARPSARGILLSLGEAGARALVSARWRSTEKIGRGRFVEAMRELGTRGGNVLASTLKTLDSTSEPALVEDLLRSIPDLRDDALGAEVSRFVQHPAVPIRRAATGAIASLWQLRAKHALLSGVDDTDEGVRIAAITGLKKIGAMDADAVKRVGKVLSMETRGSDELRAVAAAALGVAQLAARADAVAILSRAIEPRSRSVVAMFRGEDEGDHTILVETIARSLLAIGGDDGRKAVEKRASKSSGELKTKLTMMLKAPSR